MIKLDNVYKTYESKGSKTEVLKGINLEISSGDFVVIVGKSGCGKSTLLNIIGLMDTATSGDYIFKDKIVSKQKNSNLAEIRNKDIGFIFQSFNLINEFSVLENVCVPMGYSGKPKNFRTQRAKELLNNVDMSHRIKARPYNLSGGEQQRVAIARALANDSDLILADEPTGNLDEKNGDIIINILKELHKKGKTIIMVTHNIALTEIATKVIKMHDGDIIN